MGVQCCLTVKSSRPSPDSSSFSINFCVECGYSHDFVNGAPTLRRYRLVVTGKNPFSDAAPIPQPLGQSSQLSGFHEAAGHKETDQTGFDQKLKAALELSDDTSRDRHPEASALLRQFVG